MVLPEKATLGDLFSAKFVKSTMEILAGEQMNIGEKPFEELIEYYRTELGDYAVAERILEQADIDTTKLDGYIDNKRLSGVRIDELVDILEQTYRLFSVIVMASIRGKAAAWASTNMNYIPDPEKEVLDKFTKIHTVQQADDATEAEDQSKDEIAHLRAENSALKARKADINYKQAFEMKILEGIIRSLI